MLDLDTYEKISFDSEFELEDGYLYVSAKLDLLNMDGYVVKKIGRADIYIFDYDWGNPMIIDITDEKSDLRPVISEADKYFELEEEFQRFAVLDSLFIDKEYRNQRWGSKLLSSLKEYLVKGMNIDAIFLLSRSNEYGLEEEERDALQDKLNEFYKQNEFVQFEENHFFYIEDYIEDDEMEDIIYPIYFSYLEYPDVEIKMDLDKSVDEDGLNILEISLVFNNERIQAKVYEGESNIIFSRDPLIFFGELFDKVFEDMTAHLDSILDVE